MVNAVEDKCTRCPRCGVHSNMQSAVELRPGAHYLTLRCISCGVVYDAQVPSAPAMAPAVNLGSKERSLG